MRIAAIVTVMLVLLSVQVCAQTAHELKTGDVLRIRMMGSSDEYRLERIHLDTLFVFRQDDNKFGQIALGQVDRVDVKVPRSTGWGAIRGAVIGGLIGGTAGAIYALATWNDVDVDCGGGKYIVTDETCTNASRGLRFAGAVAVGGMPCILLGGIVGAMSPGERWEPIELSGAMSLRIDADRTLFVQYSRAF